MVAPERPAVDKLLAKNVLVPNIKAAADLNLRSAWSVTATPTAFGSLLSLHAPHQQQDVTLIKPILSSVGQRRPEASIQVAAIVVQIAGKFLPKVCLD